VVAGTATDPFPGTIWVADYGAQAVFVFEPADYDGGGGPTCTGADDASLDEDIDGYTNADEIDNGTNPCSAGDVPADFDGDLVSNLNDPDDDDDGILDVDDPFAIDPDDGLTTPIPLDFPWDSDTPLDTGILNLGLTGAMTNGTTTWLDQYDIANMTVIGAAGVVTVDALPNGTALGAANTQQYGLQVGVDARPASADSFEASTSLPNPYGVDPPLAGQSFGLQVGTGTQDDYVKIVAAGDNGGEMQLVKEVGGVPQVLATAPLSMPGPSKVDVFLWVDPDTAQVQASFTTTVGGVMSERILLGDPFTVPSSWFEQGFAVGLIGTSGGAVSPTSATWDFLKVLDAPTPPGTRPVITPGNVGVVEGNSGTKVVNVPVTLSAPAAQAVTVDWSTLDTGAAGIATAGVDYVAASGTVTFAPGETAKTVPITVIGDTVAEAPLYLGEWALVAFSNPSANADLDTSFYGLGIVIITDDDPT